MCSIVTLFRPIIRLKSHLCLFHIPTRYGIEIVLSWCRILHPRGGSMSNLSADGDQLKTGNLFLAVGILDHTTDAMILDGSAVPRLRKALSLVNNYEDCSRAFKEFLRKVLCDFRSRHPRFALTQLVDQIFEPGPKSWPGMDEEFDAIERECLRRIAESPMVDFARDTNPDGYNELLEAMAGDSSIVNDTLDRIPPVRATPRRRAWRVRMFDRLWLWTMKLSVRRFHPPH
jgi:hypothetical protein